MADEACVGTIFLTEAGGHLRIGDVIQAVGHSFEQHTVHDLRHVARCAAAALGFGRVARVRLKSCCIRGVALETHLVRLFKEFQRPLILAVRRVEVVAVAAMGAALLKALRAEEGSTQLSRVGRVLKLLVQSRRPDYPCHCHRRLLHRY